jgi:hypothetical protein
MTDPIEFRPRSQQTEDRDPEPADTVEPTPVGLPSTAVYARVGDAVLRTAQDGVRRHLPAQDIIREIRDAHGVRLNVGELRLLLASRRI